jgi:SNF2 family DNA or RNA helicase
MLNRIKALIQKAPENEERFQIKPHPYGISLIGDDLKKFREGNGSSLMQHQFVTLKILAEEGLANELDNGFDISSEEAVRLGNPERLLLGLPKPWPGEFRITFNGTTSHPSFSIVMELVLPSGQRIIDYSIQGPIISISENEVFLPNQAQWILLNTVQTHKGLMPDERTESSNLMVVYKLQTAQKEGAAVDLAHFKDIEVIKPEKIGLSVDQKDDGSLDLAPDIEGIASHEETVNRLHQLDDGNPVLHIKDKIVVLDDERFNAIEEILSNRVIPPGQVKDFLQSPSAFIDASKVDFELGFSIRVKGATVFEPAYFGETDASETDWTGCSGLSCPPSLPFSEASSVLRSIDEVEELNQKIKEARKARVSNVNIGGQEFILGDPSKDSEYIEKARIEVAKKAQTKPSTLNEPEQQDKSPNRATVDITKEDERHELETVLSASRNYKYDGEIILPNCSRKPFSYQEIGIRWLLGIATNNGGMNWKKPFVGGLLADDMGLGKTFMALAAAVQYNHLCKNNGKDPKPCLVVAPLSLLETWKKEVELVFDPIPFRDIITLQSQGDLNRFRARKGNEIMQREHDIKEGLDAIRYVLKIGPSWGTKRLDMPERLVLTTYQAVRDYQFSLCRIDWGFVIFDEAQNIKNPNALQTRAAKGLKANFMLLATGTPVENNLTDFWCLFDTACPGLLLNYQAFRKQYILPIKQAAGADEAFVREKIGKELRGSVGNLMLRRTKEEELEGLPKKHVYTGVENPSIGIYKPFLSLEMKGDQRKWYESILGTANIRSDDEPRGKGILNALHSLRDVSLHPGLLNDGNLQAPDSIEQTHKQLAQSGKLLILKNILQQIQKRDEKVIIFVIRQQLQSYLSVCLQKIFGLQVEVINGTTKALSKTASEKTRSGIIQRFEKKEGFNILIMSPIAAGVGLTIVAANNVIHLERHWNPAKEAQATDRVYRIGANKDVNVYIPILTHPEIDSFDVHLDRLLSRKIDLNDSVVTPTEASQTDFVKSGIFEKTTPLSAEHIFRPDDMDSDLSWESFEALAALAVAHKYKGEPVLTSHPNDWGADAVIKTKNGYILIQCKHHPRGKLKSGSSVREIYAAKPKYKELLGSEIDKLIVATSASKISRRVTEAADTYQVDLWGKNDISDVLKTARISYSRIHSLLDSNRFPE